MSTPVGSWIELNDRLTYFALDGSGHDLVSGVVTCHRQIDRYVSAGNGRSARVTSRAELA
jgi:hypothetical protein